ncbi:Ger(x)C family spore germination protein [Ectobacillus ponti]|uniref:Ger(X)C family spore germination protein n=1 Tax=Ectobacillus ponti TaxID=2961894 RepID=A0AA41X7Y1_9BACI|nr:Ger(x)C family spore germination protein [Ectobacillus ponti]MCP8970457.1 Ger(x)C family spore germination protein [Ectobacillus ponti]
MLRCFFAFCCLLCLTGCWDVREVEHVWYINSLGIDYEKGRYILYPQFINFATLAKQEGSANRTPQPIYVGKGSSPVIDEAAFDFYESAQQRLSWEHIKTIVFSERVLRDGDLNQLDDFLSRFFQFRNTPWVFGTKEPIQDLLTTGSILNISPLYTTLNIPNEVTKQYSIFQPARLYRLRADFYEPGMTTAIPFLSITKERWKANKKNFPIMRYSGAAFLASKRYAGYLPVGDLAGLHWTNENMFRAPLMLKQEGKPVAEVVLRKPKLKIASRIEQGKPHFSVNVKAEGDIFQILKYIPVSEMEKLAQKQIADEIKQTYQAALKKKIDVYQLSQALYRSNPAVWNKHEVDGILPLAPSSLDVGVQVTIITSGQWKSKDLQRPFRQE